MILLAADRAGRMEAPPEETNLEAARTREMSVALNFSMLAQDAS